MLRPFSIDELIHELDRVGTTNEYVGRRQRYVAVSERLLRYSRLRSQSEMLNNLYTISGTGTPSGGVGSVQDLTSKMNTKDEEMEQLLQQQNNYYSNMRS